MEYLLESDIKNLFYILSHFKINVSLREIETKLVFVNGENRLGMITSFLEGFDIRVDISSNIGRTSTYPILAIYENQSYFLEKTKKGTFYKDADDGELQIFDKDKISVSGPEYILNFSYIKSDGKQTIFKTIIQYVIPHKSAFLQLIFGFIVILILQLISPFLMQLLIDKGVLLGNIKLVQTVIIGLVIVKISSFVAEFVRSWLFLNIGTKISVRLISDFLFKVLKVPIDFFNSEVTGDILQRVEDNVRIESFLTKQLSQFIFTILSLFVFLLVLGFYNLKLFMVFIVGAVIYIAWILFFWKIRRQIDVNLFKYRANNQNILVQMLNSIQELKLNSIQDRKRWDWQNNQVEMYEQNQKMLYINKLDEFGGLLINEIKDSIIIYLTVISVIDGNLTFGAMVAIQYILGQANPPLKSIPGFIMGLQMAILSMERISAFSKLIPVANTDALIKHIPDNKTVKLDNVSFSYGKKGQFHIRNMNLTIKNNEVTALVGSSGSGKTTLLKLILGFYTPYKGNISIGDTSLKNINPDTWFKECGAILQDSVLINDTILNNITMGASNIDVEKAIEITKKSKIFDFIDGAPKGFNTLINFNGKGLSKGQIQRLLIARLMYKDPRIVILDEATNALDADTENSILQEFDSFFQNKTVIIISHKLKTIKSANKIVVIKDGKIIEWGTHDYLMNRKSYYYSLYNLQEETNEDRKIQIQPKQVSNDGI